VPTDDPDPGASPGLQLALFPGVAGLRTEAGPRSDAPDKPIDEAGVEPADTQQLDLFAEHAVLARELDAAIADGRFEEAARFRRSIDEAYGPSATSRSLAPLDGLADVAWEGPPAIPLSTWAGIDRQLAAQPPLQARVRRGIFARLLQSHASGELVAASPDCLPALVRALVSGPGRSPSEGRLEARSLVRDSLLAGRALEGVDFREDEALADLLAEDLPPRWLACLGRIRRLWPSSPPKDAEWEALGEIARGGAGDEEPAMAFWQCLRLAESPGCPDHLLQEARRRMKQLHPDLHALFMRRVAPR
jgi:hypothetical protein